MSGRRWSARAAETGFVLLGGEKRSLLMVWILAASAAAPAEGKMLLAAKASKATEKVFIASHSRILTFDIRSGEAVVNTDGQGLYNGLVPGDSDPSNGRPKTLWTLSRPRKRDLGGGEALIKVDLHSGRVLARIEIACRAAHDILRIGNSMYALCTGDGSILELALPLLHQKRNLTGLFTPQEHANTIARGDFWVLKHKFGLSDVVRLDSNGNVTHTFKSVGTKANGLAMWRQYLVVLDSEAAAINLVDSTTGAVLQVFKLQGEQVYLKGLAVVEDRAVFGINAHVSHEKRGHRQLNAEVAVVDLQTRALISRTRVETQGQLNTIASPEQWKSVGQSTRVSFLDLEKSSDCSALSHRACKANPYCRAANHEVKRARHGIREAMQCQVCPADRFPCLPANGRREV